MSIENQHDEIEEIEGLDNKETEVSLGKEYPIDTLLIRNESRTIHDVLRRIKQGTFVMNPDFQRDFIWAEDKQSKLIESVLMRIPLPVFYLGEDDKGRMIVVDGLQRLSTFERFVNNKLRLRLPSQPELNKKRFQDISSKLQNRIEDCNLILYIIDAKAQERTKLDIFDRVNGGVPLTRQQMRNCLYDGKATQFLKTEAGTELFKKVTGGSLSTKTMRDREFVNRFCAFSLLSLEDYKGDMDDWLGLALKRMNELTNDVLQQLSEAFQKSLRNNDVLFGSHAFRKHEVGQERRSALNASLWDVLITGLAQYSEEQVSNHATELKEHFYTLLKDHDFELSITSGTNSLDHVIHRFKEFKKMFAEVFDAHSS